MTKHAFLIRGTLVFLVILASGIFYSKRGGLVELPANTDPQPDSPIETPPKNETTSSKNTEVDSPTARILHFEYAADFKNDQILVGASHNIFVAKVIRQVSNVSRVMPKTQFLVEVIYNVKGNLHGAITVDQAGGYRDGVLYVSSRDAGDLLAPASSPNAGYLLEPGMTYILATRYSERDDWYTINSFYTASSLISGNPGLSSSQLKALTESNPRVLSLLVAYPNEIPFSSDETNDTSWNSYRSLSVEQKTSVRNKILILSGVTPSSTASSSAQ